MLKNSLWRGFSIGLFFFLGSAIVNVLEASELPTPSQLLVDVNVSNTTPSGSESFLSKYRTKLELGKKRLKN